MKSLSLTRKQIRQLAELSQGFPNVNWFVLEYDNSSGIGPEITVKFSLFNEISETDTSVNITDVSSW